MRIFITVLCLLPLLAEATCLNKLKPGETIRDPAVKRQFDRSMGYPRGRPGYKVDHICALYCGGKDIVQNMQYQTIAESDAKDKWERIAQGCRATCPP